jgi:hypothetical protein
MRKTTIRLSVVIIIVAARIENEMSTTTDPPYCGTQLDLWLKEFYDMVNVSVCMEKKVCFMSVWIDKVVGGGLGACRGQC